MKLRTPLKHKKVTSKIKYAKFASSIIISFHHHFTTRVVECVQRRAKEAGAWGWGSPAVCVVLGLACFARSRTERMGTFKKNDKIIDRKGNLRDYPASQKTEVLHEKLKTVLTIVILKFMISTLNFTKFQSRTYNPGF